MVNGKIRWPVAATLLNKDCFSKTSGRNSDPRRPEYTVAVFSMGSHENGYIILWALRKE